MDLHCLLQFVFSVDLGFIKFATGASARHMSRFLAWNIFLLLKRSVFWKETSERNLIRALASGPRTLAICLFSVLGAVFI